MKDYKSSLGINFKLEDEFNSSGFIAMPICQFLYGRKWDRVALAYVAAHNPTQIRVIDSDTGLKMNSRLNRVTIYVDKHDVIYYIEQEVEIPLPDGYEYGEYFTEYLSVQNKHYGKWVDLEE